MGALHRSLAQDCVALAARLVDGTPIEARDLSRIEGPHDPRFPLLRRAPLDDKGFDRAVRQFAGPMTWRNAMASDVDIAVGRALALEPMSPTVDDQGRLARLYYGDKAVRPRPRLKESAPLWQVRPAVLQTFASHPNGYVRYKAMTTLHNRRPKSLVWRALDWVPAIRSHAVSVLLEGLHGPHRSNTNWQLAAFELVHRIAAVERCPTLVEPAIAIVGSVRTRSDATRDAQARRHQTIRLLQEKATDPAIPAQAVARDALIAFHSDRLQPGS